MPYLTNIRQYQYPEQIPGNFYAPPAQSGSVDDDAEHIHPINRRFPNPRGITDSYYPEYAPLAGPRFQVGYQFYPGVNPVTPTSITEAAHDRTIGRALIMTPPVIPWRSASIRGVRNGINFSQETAYGQWKMPKAFTIRR